MLLKAANKAVLTGFTWSGPNGFTSTVEDPVINPGDAAYPAPGTHLYAVTVTDANGCTDSASIQINILAEPLVTISAPSTICGNLAIAFDATGGGNLASQILTCMEAAAAKTGAGYSRYG